MDTSEGSEIWSEEPKFFSEWLCIYREARGWTQVQLAKAVGVHRNTVIGWETALYIPNESTVRKLAEVLNLSELQTDQLLMAAHRPPLYHVLPAESHISAPLRPGGKKAKSLKPQVPLRNPYKGLEAFGEEDVADFFGRDRLIERLLKILGEGHGPRFLALLGASGSGKTSVMMAGVIPRLKKGKDLPGSQDWCYLHLLTLGEKPLETLAYALSQHMLDKKRDLIEQELRDPAGHGLLRLTEGLVEQSGARVVLFVDQFEELFQSSSQADTRQFLNLLVSAVMEPHSKLLVLVALRVDCYSQAFDYPNFLELIRHHEIVAAMDEKELRDVIEKPAKRVKLTFQEPIIDEMIAEVEERVGALPLLQFTLYQLVERSKDRLAPNRIVTKQLYHEIGGVRKALANYTEQVYEQVPAQKRNLYVRYVFLRLVLFDAETRRLGVLMRRRAPFAEFTLPDPEKTKAVWDVISIFIAARLLVRDYVEVPLPVQGQHEEEQRRAVPTLEVSHEAVLQEWKQLHDWLAEAPEIIGRQQRLSRDAAEWEESGRSGERLYRGHQLKEAQEVATKTLLSEKEGAFLQASARRRIQSMLSIIALILLLVSSIGAAGWYGLHQPPDPTRVTILADDGIGSLRWCINNAPSGRTITFAQNVRGTIHFTSSDITVNRTLTIRGPGAGILALSSGSTNVGIHVFPKISITISDLSFKDSSLSDTSFIAIARSFITNEGTLQLTNIIVSSNSVQGESVISNVGTLTVSNSVFSGNSVQGNGGGISNEFGTLTVSNSIFSGNSIHGDGGGIYNSGTLTVSNSTFSGNSARSGGGLFNTGTLTMMNSTFSGNTSVEGGGMFNSGTLTVSNSTFSGNSARSGGGGGISNSGTLTVSNSTFSGNSAYDDGGGISNFNFFNPDSIQQYVARVDVIFCTFFDNTASQGGGGISTVQGIGSNGNVQVSKTTIRNSIVARNSATTDPDISGALSSEGYNLIQNSAKMVFAPNRGDRFVSDLSHVFAGDGHLHSNGGSTQTLALLPNSQDQAFNAVPLAVCQIKATYDDSTRMYTDQRGKPRPGTGKKACDVGAYETQL